MKVWHKCIFNAVGKSHCLLLRRNWLSAKKRVSFWRTWKYWVEFERSIVLLVCKTTTFCRIEVLGLTIPTLITLHSVLAFGSVSFTDYSIFSINNRILCSLHWLPTVLHSLWSCSLHGLIIVVHSLWSCCLHCLIIVTHRLGPVLCTD